VDTFSNETATNFQFCNGSTFVGKIEEKPDTIVSKKSVTQ